LQPVFSFEDSIIAENLIDEIERECGAEIMSYLLNGGNYKYKYIIVTGLGNACFYFMNFFKDAATQVSKIF